MIPWFIEPLVTFIQNYHLYEMSEVVLAHAMLIVLPRGCGERERLTLASE